MKISRTEVCKRVPMSLATFDRWRKLGKLETFTDDTLSCAKKHIVWVTLEALGKALGIEDEIILRQRLDLPQVIVPQPDPEPLPEPKPQPKRVPDIAEPDAFAPQPIDPATYTDSFGHPIAGNNHHKMFATVYELPRDTQSHMDPKLLGDTRTLGTDGAPIFHGGSDNHPLNSEALYEAFRKPGQPSFAEIRQIRTKPPHPNANRQAFLDAIFRDIGNGFSR